jgi:hypothetical protein
LAAAWQASGTLLGSTGADITPVIPAHAADDILILLAAARSNAVTLTTPAGWTLKNGPFDAGTAWRMYWFWKRATSGGETNPLCDWSALTGDKYGQVHTLRGAATSGDPFSASGLGMDSTDIIITTGITVPTAGQRVILIGLGSDNASASVVVTATDPAAFTQRHFSTIATGNDATGTFHDAVKATSGAIGQTNHDFNSTMPFMGVVVASVIDAATVHSIAANLDLGLVMSIALFRETFVAASHPLGLSMTAALTRETFIAAGLDLGLSMVVNLTVTPAGPVEHFIAANLPLGNEAAANLTRETFIAANLPLGLTVNAVLTRETFIAANLDLQLQQSVALIQELLIQAGFPLGMQITVNLTVEGQSGDPFLYRTLLGIG